MLRTVLQYVAETESKAIS